MFTAITGEQSAKHYRQLSRTEQDWMWYLKDMAVSTITSLLQRHKASSWKGSLAYLTLIFKTFKKLFPLAFLLQYETYFSPHL